MIKTFLSNLTKSNAARHRPSRWHLARFSSIESEADIGSTIVDTQKWNVRGFDTVSISDSMWNEVDSYPRTLAWKLHQLAFCSSLIAFDRKYNSTQGSALAERMITSWWRMFQSSPHDKSNMAWHDHGTALRLQNLLLLRSHLPPSSFLDDLCIQHGRLLMSESFYSRGNNHGLDQSLALFECGHEMATAEMHQIASARILDEIKVAFAADGGHVENSTGYHHFGINQVKLANELAIAYTGKAIEQTRLVERAEAILSHMTRPDRKLPHIGDTQDFIVRRLPQPAETDLTLPDCGWSIFRSGWDAQAVHGVLKCGFLSQSHRQDDDLSISLFAFGEEWLVDGGLFAYQPNDPMRIYMRSHAAHSLPYVVGMKASRDLSSIGHFSRITSYTTNSEFYHVSAVTRMWPGFEAQRTVHFDRFTSSLHIHDRIRPLSEAARMRAAERSQRGYAVYGTRFLIPDVRSILRGPDGARIVGSTRSLQILSTLRSKLIKGQTEPAIAGWRSTSVNSAIPAFDLSFLSSSAEYDEHFHLHWVEANTGEPAG
jgi:hypothetical protein